MVHAFLGFQRVFPRKVRWETRGSHLKPFNVGQPHTRDIQSSKRKKVGMYVELILTTRIFPVKLNYALREV